MQSIRPSFTTASEIFSKMAACKFTLVARSFSSSASQSQMIKTPIPVFGTGGRYAAALYSAAMKTKDVDKIEGDLVKFENTMSQDKRFSQLLKDPTIKKNLKSNMVNEAAKKLGLSKSATNCLSLLAENGRLKDFSAILSNIKAIMAVHRGEITCEVTSAKPLTDAQKKEIEAALKKFAKKNEAILMTTKVDPSIIGGLIVSIGDKYVDMSISSKLKKYTKILEEGF